MKREKGYPIPSTIDPGKWQCVKVYIPDDPLYLGAFWESYSFFSRWLAWELTNDTKGKQAARVWFPAWMTARSEYEQALGCSAYPIPSPPYTGSTQDGRSPEEATVDDILWWYKSVIQEVIDRLGDSEDPQDIIDDLTARMTALTGKNYGTGFTELVNYLYALTPVQRQDWADAIDWQQVRSRFFCEDHCQTLLSHWIEWLLCYADYMAQVLTWTSQQISAALGTLFDLMQEDDGTGYGWAAQAAGGGGVDFGFGSADCWEAVFDFTINDYGWVAGPAGFAPQLNAGAWVSGVGWTPTAIRDSLGTFTDYAAAPEKAFAESFILHVEVHANFSVIRPNAQLVIWFQDYSGGPFAFAPVTATGENVLAWDDYWPATKIQCMAAMSQGDEFVLHKVIVRGTGNNPF